MVEKVSGLYWKRITCPLSKLSDLTLSYRSSLSISVTMSLESPGPQTSDGHTQHFPAFLLCFPVHRNTLHTKLLLLRDGGMASAIQNCFSYLFSTSFSDMKLNPDVVIIHLFKQEPKDHPRFLLTSSQSIPETAKPPAKFPPGGKHCAGSWGCSPAQPRLDSFPMELTTHGSGREIQAHRKTHEDSALSSCAK
nr:uncharacterized protein LOC129525307 isoform X3 [Gorilla gorilla gorilla]